jgi:hypothetical protein
MDRRRYVPSPEGLEVRTMLSTTAASNPLAFLGGSATTTQTLPITFQQKAQRIEKIPENLRALEPNRSLPQDVIHNIQLGMYEVMGRMTKPPSTALTNYNLAMRKIVFKSSLSSANAQLLNNGFRGVLRSANTPDPGLTTLTTAVDQLVTQVDTASVNPVFLATNDSAYLLQLATVLGQPMPAPRVPTISKGSGKQVSPGVSITPLAHPYFSGTYEYGTTMQMIDPFAGNAVVGQATVAKNGQYTIRVSTPLSAGHTYRFRMQAVDEAMHFSRLSREFIVKVVPPKNQAKSEAHSVTLGLATPRGPLAGK